MPSNFNVAGCRSLNTLRQKVLARLNCDPDDYNDLSDDAFDIGYEWLTDHDYRVMQNKFGEFYLRREVEYHYDYR